MTEPRSSSLRTFIDQQHDLSLWGRRVLWFLVMVGISCRLLRYFAGFPLWLDEVAVASQFFDRAVWDCYTPLMHTQVAPPLFLFVEQFIFWLCGPSAWALRLVPLLASIGALILFAFWAKKYLPEIPAVSAVGIIAVSALPIRYAAEIKPYSIDLLASVIVLVLATRWCRYKQWRDMALLALMIPLLMGFSYPVVFVLGGLMIALMSVLTRDQSARKTFAVITVITFLSFMTLFMFTARGQYNTTETGMLNYWKTAFPPLEIWPLIKWLVWVHVGGMFAYPFGGTGGGSIVTVILIAFGLGFWIRQRRWFVVLLLMCPFILNLLAAAMRRYPYGDNPRVLQHLVPLIAIAVGFGFDCVLQWAGRIRWPHARLVLSVVGLVVLIGVAAKTFRVFKQPYLRPDDARMALLATELLQEANKNKLILPEGMESAPPGISWYLRASGQPVPTDFQAVESHPVVTCLVFDPSWLPPAEYHVREEKSLNYPDMFVSCRVLKLAKADATILP